MYKGQHGGGVRQPFLKWSAVDDGMLGGRSGHGFLCMRRHMSILVQSIYANIGDISIGQHVQETFPRG